MCPAVFTGACLATGRHSWTVRPRQVFITGSSMISCLEILDHAYNKRHFMGILFGSFHVAYSALPISLPDWPRSAVAKHSCLDWGSGCHVRDEFTSRRDSSPSLGKACGHQGFNSFLQCLPIFILAFYLPVMLRSLFWFLVVNVFRPGQGMLCAVARQCRYHAGNTRQHAPSSMCAISATPLL